MNKFDVKSSFEYIKQVLNKIDKHPNANNIRNQIQQIRKLNQEIINYTEKNNLITHDFIRESLNKKNEKQELTKNEKLVYSKLRKINDIKNNLQKKYNLTEDDIIKYIFYKKFENSYEEFKENMKNILNKNINEEMVTDLLQENNIKMVFDFDDTIVNLFYNWLKNDLEIKANFYKDIILKQNFRTEKYKNLTKKDIEEYNRFLKEKILSNKEPFSFLKQLNDKYQKYLRKNNINLNFNSRIFFEKIKDKKKLEEYINYLFPSKIDENFYRKLIRSIKNEKKIELSKNDIRYYGYFGKVPFGMDYLYKGDIYIDEETGNELVQIDKTFIQFYNTYLKDNPENVVIITSSFPGTEENKLKFIKKYFPELEEKVITTHYKAHFIDGTAIFFDDGTHHLELAVRKNPFVMGITFINKYAEYTIFNNRILPVKDYNEISKIVPVVSVYLINRTLNPNLQIEYLLKTDLRNKNNIQLENKHKKERKLNIKG